MVLLSPLLNLIHSALRQIIQWLFYECLKVDILPEIPEQLQGANLEIEFISTLAQALKAQNIASMERFTTFSINLSNTVDPALKYKINGAEMIDAYAEYANVDPAQVVPTETVEAIKEQMAQEEAAQKMLAQVQQGSQIIKNVGGADSYGSELMNRLGFS